VRFKSQRSGYPMLCKPPGCRQLQPGFESPQPSHDFRAAGESVPGTWSGMGCRPITQLTDSSEGMSWACMVLSLVPHQIPPPWGRCSPVCRQLCSAPSGGLWLPETSTHPPHRHTRQARPVRGGPSGCTTWRSCPILRACRGLPASVVPSPGLGLAVAPAANMCCERRTAREAGRAVPTGSGSTGTMEMARDSGGNSGNSDCTTSTGPADRPERDSGWQ
jgi:hypothetical protein